MAEKTTKKNTKGTKKVVKEKTTKKVATKKAAPKKEVKKVTPVKEVKKAAPVKEVKKEEKVVIKKENKMKGKIKEVVDKITSNRPFAIALCVILVLAIALTITLCHKVIPKTKDGKQVVASLKGKTITADDLYLKLKDNSGSDTLFTMIDEYIIGKEVKYRDEDKEYVQGVVDQYKEQAEYYGVSISEFFANYGLNIENEKQLYNIILKNYGATLAVQKFIGDQASEKDLKEYYENNYSDSLNLRHILIEVDEDGEDAAIEKAKDLIKELDNTNKNKLEEKFTDLAKNNSTDPGTYENGGLMEDVTKKAVVSEFFEAAVALKDGEYTKEPVKSSYGYHIIYRISSTPLKKFKDMKDSVKMDYGKDLLNSDSSLFTIKWDELRKSYKLNIVDTNIQNDYDKMVGNAKEKTED